MLLLQSMNNKLLRLSIILAITVCLSNLSPISVLAQNNVKFSFYAAPDTQKNYSDIKQGDKLKGKMELVLHDDVIADFLLAFTDDIKKEPDSPMNVKNWIKFPQGYTVHMDGTAPGPQKKLIPFEFSIPKDVMPGDYIGYIEIQSVSKPKTETQSKGIGVDFGLSIATDFKFSVAGHRKHRIIFTSMKSGDFIPSATKESRQDMELHLYYANEGNATLRPFVHLVATDMLGKTIYDTNLTLPNVIPAKSEHYYTTIPGFDKLYGWLNLTADLSYSVVNLQGTADKQIYNVGQGRLKIYLIPWLQLSIALSIVFIISIFFIYRKAKLILLINRSINYTIQENDTLQSISEKMSSNPKNIIVVNKLKSPYFLKTGTNILIPK